jgi:hypothetical protein
VNWQINTYRVLLTRARHETIIFVPEGDSADVTRDPAGFDAVADFLIRCGAGMLDGTEDAIPAEQDQMALL